MRREIEQPCPHLHSVLNIPLFRRWMTGDIITRSIVCSLGVVEQDPGVKTVEMETE